MSGTSMGPARKKRRVRFSRQSPFPVPVCSITGEPASTDHWFYYTGWLHGATVHVYHSGDISFLYKMGFYGKGNLSRSQPDFNHHFHTACVPAVGDTDVIQPRVMSRRRYKTHVKWNKLKTCDRMSTSSDDGWTEDEMEESTKEEENCFENTDFQMKISDKSEPHNDTEQADWSRFDRGSKDEKTVKLDWEQNVKGQNDASWEEDDENVIVSKDERSKAEKSWDLEKGDDEFWSVSCDTSKLEKLENKTKADNDVVVTCVNSNRNISEHETSPGRDVSKQTRHQENVDKNRTNKIFGSHLPEISKNISNNSQKNDNASKLNVISSVKVKSSNIEDHNTRNLNTALEPDSESKLQNKCISETDGDILKDESGNETKLELQKICTKQTVCDEQFLSNYHHDVIHNSCLEDTTDGLKNNQSKALSLDELKTNQSKDFSLDELKNNQSKTLSLDTQCFDEAEGDVLVINDTDNEGEKQTQKLNKTKWRPVLKKDVYPVVEHLQLSFEEAFFLSYGLGCLVVKNANREPLGLSSLWRHFCEVQKTFLPNYIAYHHFRSKGWVPKSGLKFGCDFILYREGPPFYHGSYSVIVKQVEEDTLLENTDNACRSLSWTSLSGLNRITEHVAKELLICYVIKPRDITPESLSSPKCISDFMVQEIQVSRWISSQEREKKEVEEFP